MATKCNHQESRLSCSSCSGPICSNCLVQCPVGFRCKTCVGTVKTASSLSGMVVARTLALCAAIGFGAGWLMPMIAIPFLSCIICYFMGLFTGRWLTRVLDRRLGTHVGKVIVFGLLIGMSLSPYGMMVFVIADSLKMMFTGQTFAIFSVLSAIAGSLFSPVGFVVGILRPTVWGERC